MVTLSGFEPEFQGLPLEIRATLPSTQIASNQHRKFPCTNAERPYQLDDRFILGEL